MDDSPKCEYKTIKLLEDNIGENLDDLGCDEAFFRWIDKLNFGKVKNSFSVKDSIKRVKRQPAGWEKISVNHVSDKSLLSEKYKELQLNNKKQF